MSRGTRCSHPFERDELEKVVEAAGHRREPALGEVLHAGSQVAIPESPGHVWVRSDASAPAQDEMAEEPEPLQAEGLVCVEVCEGDGLDPVDV